VNASPGFYFSHPAACKIELREQILMENKILYVLLAAADAV
jgi:hypothetical protein